ncbi:MAG: MCE family protein [Gammaproteobacteria bacterium]|nr:MCE family protein [Gammaproteobacteria bacterium]
MNVRANPTLIGAFIVGAVVLLIGGVFLFGSGRLFQDNMDAVLYFDGDVQGLNVGAAVKFRGVRVGEVTSISTMVEDGTTEVTIPVTINVVGTRGLARQMAGDRKIEPFAFMVKRGLRGQLRTESLVTGLLFVQLDFYPDAPPADLPLIDPATGLHRIPTVPTILQEAQVTMRGLVEKLEKLPLADMLESLHGVLEGADKLLNAPGVQQAPERLESTLTQLQAATEDTSTRLGPLLISATEAMVNINSLVSRASRTLDHLDTMSRGDGVRLLQDLDAAVKEANATLIQTRAAMAGVEDLAQPTSATGHQLRSTLNELQAAARAVNELASALEAQPNAVIFGRQEGMSQ